MRPSPRSHQERPNEEARPSLDYRPYIWVRHRKGERADALARGLQWHGGRPHLAAALSRSLAGHRLNAQQSALTCTPSQILINRALGRSNTNSTSSSNIYFRPLDVSASSKLHSVVENVMDTFGGNKTHVILIYVSIESCVHFETSIFYPQNTFSLSLICLYFFTLCIGLSTIEPNSLLIAKIKQYIFKVIFSVKHTHPHTQTYMCVYAHARTQCCRD